MVSDFIILVEITTILVTVYTEGPFILFTIMAGYNFQGLKVL